MTRTILRIAALLPLLASGCMYERIDIYTSGDIYSGEILSHYKDVEAGSGRIILKPGARFAILTAYGTQFLGQFDVAITAGEGMTAYLRTVPYQFTPSQGIAFRYAVDGCSVRRADGTVVPLNYNAETGTQTISLYNEANLVSISAGCRALYQEETPLPGTEYIIFETLPGSTVELRSVTYFDTGEE